MFLLSNFPVATVRLLIVDGTKLKWLLSGTLGQIRCGFKCGIGMCIKSSMCKEKMAKAVCDYVKTPLWLSSSAFISRVTKVTSGYKKGQFNITILCEAIEFESLAKDACPCGTVFTVSSLVDSASHTRIPCSAFVSDSVFHSWSITTSFSLSSIAPNCKNKK